MQREHAGPSRRVRERPVGRGLQLVSEEQIVAGALAARAQNANLRCFNVQQRTAVEGRAAEHFLKIRNPKNGKFSDLQSVGPAPIRFKKISL